MAEIITKDSEEFKELTGWMKKIGKSVEAATARIRPAIADEHYLQGEDVCEMLHISKRTLQTLRDEGAIPYYHHRRENTVSRECPVRDLAEKLPELQAIRRITGRKEKEEGMLIRRIR